MTGPTGRRGVFITMEGGEGGGKSTQVRLLLERLHAAGIAAIATREPGGSPVAEALRSALLSGTFEALGPRIEALLFSAARIDHLDQTITPALDVGTWVISDRFHDSTRAYQGALGELEPRFLDLLERVTLAGTRPDLTLVLDLPADVGIARADARRARTAAPDRFEKQSLAFHDGLRAAFLSIAGDDPRRCVVVDATQSPDDVGQAIWDTVTHRLTFGSPTEESAGRFTDTAGRTTEGLPS